MNVFEQSTCSIMARSFECAHLIDAQDKSDIGFLMTGYQTEQHKWLKAVCTCIGQLPLQGNHAVVSGPLAFTDIRGLALPTESLSHIYVNRIYGVLSI